MKTIEKAKEDRANAIACFDSALSSTARSAADLQLYLAYRDGLCKLIKERVAAGADLAYIERNYSEEMCEITENIISARIVLNEDRQILSEAIKLQEEACDAFGAALADESIRQRSVSEAQTKAKL